MAGCRPLTEPEERALLRVVRKLDPRDRALVTSQLLTGFRISEVLSLTVGAVFKGGQIVSKIGIAPHNMKGGYGTTRWVPVLPELERALASLIRNLGQRYELSADLPLFLSRQDDTDGQARAITRERAHKIVKGAFARAGIADDGRLGTHSLRKTFARKVYAHAGKDLMVLKKALNHSSVAITQRYLEVVEDEVFRAIQRCDRSRPRKSAPPPTAFAVSTTRKSSEPSVSVVSTAPTPAIPAATTTPIGQLDFLSVLSAA
jgi:integrase